MGPGANCGGNCWPGGPVVVPVDGRSSRDLGSDRCLKKPIRLPPDAFLPFSSAGGAWAGGGGPA